MGAGLGVRQRALVRALKPGVVVWVVPPDVNHAEAVCWRRAAKSLVARGRAKALYVRRLDRSGRWTRHLALVPPDSELSSDAFPAGSPSHVDPGIANLFETLPCTLKAEIVRDRLGVPVSGRTAARRAAEHHREQPEPPAVFAA